ncbi:hypothetical protein [Vibrio crassostreae]|uniref:hypothetical protein n=1 Tax=Vibrio crassostreae TaxID=246167 RepID=UPI001B3060DB|nr:hypothetical protein [Vibrio crassostreae]
MSFSNIFSEVSEHTIEKQSIKQGRLYSIKNKTGVSIDLLAPIAGVTLEDKDYSTKHKTEVHVTYDARLALPALTHYRRNGESGFTQFTEEAPKTLVDFAMKATQSAVILKEGHEQGLTAKEAYVAAYGELPPAISPVVALEDPVCGYGDIQVRRSSFDSPAEYDDFNDVELDQSQFDELLGELSGEHDDLICAVDDECSVALEEDLGVAMPLSPDAAKAFVDSNNSLEPQVKNRARASLRV